MSGLLTLAESVAAHARTQPHKIGVRDSRRALSYAEWDVRASRLASALLARGLQPGDRVALLAYNCIEWLEIYVALARAGLVAVPINFRLVGPEVAYIVQHSEARAFIVQDPLCALVEGIRADLPTVDGGFVHFGSAAAPAGWLGLRSADSRCGLGRPGGRRASRRPVRADVHLGHHRPPQGGDAQPRRQRALLALATPVLEFGLTRDDTGLLVMPLCHANSLYFSVTFAMLVAPPSWSMTGRISMPRHCSGCWHAERTSPSLRWCPPTTS